MMETWGTCECGDGPEAHEMVVVRPACIDPGTRVLFEGTLGACPDCGCRMYARYVPAPAAKALP
jgi:hypothetical protein